MPLQIQVPMDKIEAFCRKWKVQRMWLFGSALRDDFGPESDVDVLVEFAPEARWSLLDLVHLQETFSDVVKTDKTGLSKTAHTRWMICAFANFLPGSTIFRLA